jgi:CheY-like chemotaxis protein
MADKIGKSVLVIDDEPDVRLFLKTVLEDAGFDVMLAANGKEALERVTEKKPDVISLDLVMPKMSGLKFYKYYSPRHGRIWKG